MPPMNSMWFKTLCRRLQRAWICFEIASQIESLHLEIEAINARLSAGQEAVTERLRNQDRLFVLLQQRRGEMYALERRMQIVSGAANPAKPPIRIVDGKRRRFS